MIVCGSCSRPGARASWARQAAAARWRPSSPRGRPTGPDRYHSWGRAERRRYGTVTTLMDRPLAETCTDYLRPPQSIDYGYYGYRVLWFFFFFLSTENILWIQTFSSPFCFPWEGGGRRGADPPQSTSHTVNHRGNPGVHQPEQSQRGTHRHHHPRHGEQNRSLSSTVIWCTKCSLSENVPHQSIKVCYKMSKSLQQWDWSSHVGSFHLCFFIWGAWMGPEDRTTMTLVRWLCLLHLGAWCIPFYEGHWDTQNHQESYAEDHNVSSHFTTHKSF